jgi:hypothetical protein
MRYRVSLTAVYLPGSYMGVQLMMNAIEFVSSDSREITRVPLPACEYILYN